MKNISDINDIQAESGAISTLLYHPDFILHSDFLKPSHFNDKKNSCIYWAIQELYKSGVDKIDSFNLSSMINSNNAVKKKMKEFDIKSLDELIDLAKNVERNTIEEYLIIAKQVTSLAFKRELYKKLNELQQYCFDDKYSLGELNTIVYDGINKIAEEFIISDRIEPFGKKVDNIITDIKSRQYGENNYGIPSKFQSLNEYVQFEPTELVCLEAMRKMGKSMYMMCETIHKLKNGIGCVYFDTEMSDRNFTERMLANLSGVTVYKIKNGDYTASEEEKLNSAVEFLRKAPLVHIYDPSLTNDKIYTTCKILKYKINLKFVVYDYLKSSEKESSTQYNDLGNKCNFLKNSICGGLNLTGLVGAQQNRKGTIGDSYKIEQYASSILVLRPKTSDEIATDGQDCGNYALQVLANRNGSQMAEDEYIDLIFSGNTCEIDQAKKQHKKEDIPV